MLKRNAKLKSSLSLPLINNLYHIKSSLELYPLEASWKIIPQGHNCLREKRITNICYFLVQMGIMLITYILFYNLATELLWKNCV